MYYLSIFKINSMDSNYQPSAKEKLAENIKILRRNMNKTKAQVSDESGISYSFLHDIENLKRSPSLDTIDKLAKYYNVEVYELFL